MSRHPATMSEPVAEVVVHVCVTCRRAEDADDAGRRPGARLFEALGAALAEGRSPVAVRLEPVECLSVCRRPCTVAVTGPGRWTYVYGDLDPEAAVATILAGVERYAHAPAGIVPWRERPEAFRKNVIARIPPARPTTEDAIR